MQITLSDNPKTQETVMAKGQQRTNKQTKKPKSVEKKPSGPKYLRSSEGIQSAKLGEHKGQPKPAGK